MKRAFLLGAYGCGNRGDDAILQAICASLPDCKLTVTTGRKNDVANEFPVKSTPCRLNEGFSILILFHMIVSSVRIFWHIAHTDALIFGGGSLIHDLTAYNLPFMFFWHAVAKVLRKPVYYACIGIGPLKTKRGKHMCSKWLSKASGVFPRDLRGANLCTELGVQFTPVCDAAFSYKSRADNAQAILSQFGLESENYICITASRWLSNENYWNNSLQEESELITAHFSACVAEIQKRLSRRIVFVPSEERDYALGKKIGTMIDELDYICLPSTLRCEDIECIVENSYFMFGMRMHPLIFALRQGVPVISIAYDEKVNELMRGMDLAEFSVGLNELQPQIILDKLDMIESNRDIIVQKIKRNADQNSKRAQLCFEIIRKTMGVG